jgi:Holliday junction resolvase RusA-like endonuclease
MKIHATILVEPAPKLRPRVAVKGGKKFVYTPHKTVHTENLIREALADKEAFGEGVPIKLWAVFYRPRPKSLPKRVTMPVTKPDLINYLSLLADAIEKYAYQSDSQITSIVSSKRFGTPPRIEITLEEDK